MVLKLLEVADTHMVVEALDLGNIEVHVLDVVGGDNHEHYTIYRQCYIRSSTGNDWL